MTGQGIDGVAGVSYAYTAQGELDTLTRSATGTNATQSYGFAYDDFGKTTAISIGSRTLASYSYAQKNGQLSHMSYGNGAYTNYLYDRLGRTTQKMTSSGDTYSYAYTGDGQLYSLIYNDESYYYTYDTLGRLIGTTQKDSAALVQQSWRQYDDSGNVTALSTNLPGLGAFSESYAYNTDASDTISDGVLTQKGLPSGKNLVYNYDSIGRLTGRNYGGVIGHAYAYLDGAQGGTTTTLASNVRVRFADASYSLRELDYLYDDNGNIIQVYNRQLYKSALYSYDTLNQLTAAVLPGYFGDAQTRLNYTYDSFGNLLTASDGTNTHIYEYEDAEWRDLLTAYDGHEITYDAIGNPLQYYGNAQFVWRNGRQLQARLTAQGATVYSYQADGLRTKKALPDGSYSLYYWLDGALLAEERHTADGALAYTFVFDYDEMGAPVGFALRRGTSDAWENYFYAKNLQGDIEELYRIGATANDCDRVAYYEYDPWGKPLRVRDADGAQVSDPAHIANLNPLRYRGYYYDSDTGFYYLQSRYYDPQIGRFINVDSQLNTAAGILGFNLFTYCNNNPTKFTDSDGRFPFFAITAAIGAVVGAVVGGVVAAKKGGNVWAGIGIGAAAGALIGAGLGAAAGAVLAGSITAATSSVIAGGGALVTAITTGGLGAGATYISNNLSRAAGSFSSTAQVAASRMKDVASKGKAGETLAGIVKNSTRIPSLTGTAAYRIPDQLDVGAKILGEVKNYAGTLSYTNQLKDFVMWCQENGYQMYLYTNAKLTGPLQQLVDSGVIQLFSLG